MLEHVQYYPEIDLFASKLNAQLLRFFLYRPDHLSEVTNAFSVSWENKNFSCIDRILQNISAGKGTGLLGVQNWPTQFWFPILMVMLISEPFVIPPSINELELPCNLKEAHPLWRRLDVMGCMLSEKSMST